MKYEFTNAFIKDVKKSPPEIQSQVKDLIDGIKAAQGLTDLHHIKKMKGFSDAYRMRLGDYRAGFFLKNDILILVRILHRREVYRYFP